MTPKEELYDEIILATSLYKESLEILDEVIVADKSNDQAVKQLHEAREYLFSFLEIPNYRVI